MMGRPRSSIESRFWPKVDRRGADECWPWLAARNKQGYGVFQLADGGQGKPAQAHRIAWELAVGRAPVGLVLHTCDNPPCCNPAHLYEGSHGDNVRDMIERGRARFVSGEAHGRGKLTAAQVAEIRDSMDSLDVLADRYGVTVRHVRKVRQGTVWKRL